MKRPDRDTAARPAKDQPLCFLRSSSSRSFNVIERSLGLTSVQASSRDRKSTRLNSSHDQISYAVFCLKKKKKKGHRYLMPKETHGHYVTAVQFLKRLISHTEVRCKTMSRCCCECACTAGVSHCVCEGPLSVTCYL